MNSKSSRRTRKFRRARILQTSLALLFLFLLLSTSFNSITSIASASPPSTGDIAWANATASYTGVSKWQQQPTANLKLWAGNNSTATALNLSSTSTSFTIWSKGNVASALIPLNQYTVNGTVDLRINGQLENVAGYLLSGGYVYNNVGTVYANLTANTGTWTWKWVPNFVGRSSGSYRIYVYFAPEWNITSDSILESLNITETADLSLGTNFEYAPATLQTFDNSVIGIDGTGLSGYETFYSQASALNFVYGWSYDYKSITSSYSVGNINSYTLNWTASQRTNTTYNSLTQSGATSGHFTGSLSVTSVTFQADSMDFNQPYYSISYFLNENTTAPATDVYGAEGYIYGIGENGNFFNSTPIYFNYTVPSGASTSYSISYKVTISNVTLTNPNAPVEDFALINTDFTEYSVSKSGSTLNIVGYVNYSSAQSTSVKFQTCRGSGVIEIDLLT